MNKENQLKKKTKALTLNKIWAWVLAGADVRIERAGCCWDTDARWTALERASNIYKKQTCPLVRGAPQVNKRVIVKSNKYLVVSPRWGLTQKITD
jgi:hypothetical protein